MRPTEGLDAALLQLRPARLDDASRMASIHAAARRAASMPDSTRDLAGLTSWLGARVLEGEVWVAVRDRVVVGYVGFTDVWLDDLYVDPSASREGVGSALLDLVKTRLVTGFGLWVFAQNAEARAFYSQHGLLELETTDGSANAEQCPDIRLVWPGRDPVVHLRNLLGEADAQLCELTARRTALTAALDNLRQETGLG